MTVKCVDLAEMLKQLKPKLILPCNTCHVSPSDVYRIAIKEGNNKTICVSKFNRGSNIKTLSLCKKNTPIYQNIQCTLGGKTTVH